MTSDVCSPATPKRFLRRRSAVQKARKQFRGHVHVKKSFLSKKAGREKSATGGKPENSALLKCLLPSHKAEEEMCINLD